MVDKQGRFTKRYFVNEDFFTEKGFGFYYLLGLLGADGNVKNNKTFSISQSGKHGKDLINYISKLIESTYPIYYHKQNNSYCLTVTNETIVNILTEYNIIPNKTLNFTLSKKINDEYFRYFLQGYIDGDGSIGIYDNGSGVKTPIISLVGTEEFILATHKKLKTRGNIRQIKRCQNLFEIRFYGKKVLDLYFEIYHDGVIYESYKYNKLLKFVQDDTVGGRYKKYYSIKNEIIEQINEGVKILTLSNQYGIPIKTLYSWKYRQK